jgi:hypothetical protein
MVRFDDGYEAHVNASELITTVPHRQSPFEIACDLIEKEQKT